MRQGRWIRPSDDVNHVLSPAAGGVLSTSSVRPTATSEARVAEGVLRARTVACEEPWRAEASGTWCTVSGKEGAVFWDTRHPSQKSGRSCVFCGKPEKTVQKLIASPAQHICHSCRAASTLLVCEECVQRWGRSTAKDHGRQESASSLPLTVPKPTEIKATLDDYVIGQDRAKKVLAVAAHNEADFEPGAAHARRPAKGQHPDDRFDGNRQDAPVPDLGPSASRAVHDCGRHDADGSRLCGRGRGKCRAEAAPELRLRRGARRNRHYPHR